MQTKPAILCLVALALVSCDVAGRSQAGGGGHNHRVRKGETLFSIAEREYGNGLEWDRLAEANPWVDPDHLRVGQIIYVPRVDRPPADLSATRRAYMLDPGTGNFEGAPPPTADPPPSSQSRNVFRNILPKIADKTLFGVTVPRMFSFVLIACLVHGFVQGFMIWITANVTFVREASFRKSMKAIFMTEALTLCTLALLIVVGLLMVYVGTANPGEVTSTELFPTIEEYLGHPVGIAIAAFGLLFLYVVLSLRFVPQVFGLEMGRAFTVVFLGVLIPHILGLYLVGQRLGLID